MLCNNLEGAEKRRQHHHPPPPATTTTTTTTTRRRNAEEEEEEELERSFELAIGNSNSNLKSRVAKLLSSSGKGQRASSS